MKTYYREWQGIPIVIEWEEEAFGWDGAHNDSDFKLSHISVMAYKDRTPLPVSETGYKSLFQHPDTVLQWGGPVEFIMALLDEWAKGEEWQKIKFTSRQKEIF